MKFLIILLFLVGICYGEEFKSIESSIAEELVAKIELATGLDLEGKDQIGYMSSSKAKIEIKLKDRELTQVEKDIINETIKNFRPKSAEQQKQEQDQKEEAFKIQMGWTAEQLTAFREAFIK